MLTIRCAVPVTKSDDIIIVNKPKGMVVHPGAGHYTGTVVNALLYHCKDLSGINGILRPGIVHRIDKDTSGVIICAKNDFSHKNLADQLKEHSITRLYEAIVLGYFQDLEGTITGDIGRNPKDRLKMAVTDKNSRPAQTSWSVLNRYNGYTHLRCQLQTGRTHQIRVHLSSIGHPLLGDGLYGARCPDKGLEGQCLHARTLKFIHPRTNEQIIIETELPDYFLSVLSRLGPILS